MVRARILLLVTLLAGAVSLQAVGEKSGKEEETPGLNLFEGLPNEIKNHIASYLESDLFEHNVLAQTGVRVQTLTTDSVTNYAVLLNGVQLTFVHIEENNFLCPTFNANPGIIKISVSSGTGSTKEDVCNVIIPSEVMLDWKDQPIYSVQSEDKKWGAIALWQVRGGTYTIMIFHRDENDEQKARIYQEVTVHPISFSLFDKVDKNRFVSLYFNKEMTELGVLAYKDPRKCTYGDHDSYEFQIITFREDPKKKPQFTLPMYFTKMGMPICRSLNLKKPDTENK